MKECPKCRVLFSDSQTHCLNDGTPLVVAGSAGLGQPVHRPSPQPPPAAPHQPDFRQPASQLGGAPSSLPARKSPIAWIVLALLVACALALTALIAVLAYLKSSQAPEGTSLPPMGADQTMGVRSETPNDRLLEPTEVSMIASSTKDPAPRGVDCRPSSAYDGDVETSWCEGVAGDGSGESLTVTFNGGPYKVTRILIVAGYDKEKDDEFGDRWTLNNRPKKVRVALGGAFYECAVNPENRGFQPLNFPGSSPVEGVTLFFDDVIKGTAKTDSDLCISEIQVYVEK